MIRLGYILKIGFFTQQSTVRTTRKFDVDNANMDLQSGVLGGAYLWSLPGFRHEEQVTIGALVSGVERLYMQEEIR